MKKTLLSAMLAASVLLTASGCSSPQAVPATEVDEYVGVCIDPETQNRVDDDYCEEDQDHYNPYFTPYFYPYGYVVPGIGYGVYGGYSTISAPYRMGFSKTGGSTTGFRSTKPLYAPKGYTLPAGATVKQATPKATQAPAPKGLSKTPAPFPTNVPKAPVRTTKTSTQVIPQNNYKAPSSGLKKPATSSSNGGPSYSGSTSSGSSSSKSSSGSSTSSKKSTSSSTTKRSTTTRRK